MFLLSSIVGCNNDSSSDPSETGVKFTQPGGQEGLSRAASLVQAAAVFREVEAWRQAAPKAGDVELDKQKAKIAALRDAIADSDCVNS